MQEQISRACPVCGKTYTALIGRLKHGRQTTCSRDCSYRLRADGLDQKTWFACAVCGKQVSRSPRQIKAKHGATFCSRTCHYAGRSAGLSKRIISRPYNISDAARIAWRAGAQKTRDKRIAQNNYVQTDETRAKLSITTARALARGDMPTVSKLEGIVAAELAALGIRFEPQRAFRAEDGRFAYVVDFWLPDYDAALEVNGTYWHADPRFYPGPLNATQSRCVEKFNRKREDLTSRGIQVVEVWEHELKQSPRQAVLDAYARLA